MLAAPERCAVGQVKGLLTADAFRQHSLIPQPTAGHADLIQTGAGPCRVSHRTPLHSQALRLLFTRLEHSATLALAFVHAHELAVKDMTTYGELADWDEEREREQAEAARVGVAVHLDDIVEHMRKNVTQQVRPCACLCMACQLRHSLEECRGCTAADEAELLQRAQRCMTACLSSHTRCTCPKIRWLSPD